MYKISKATAGLIVFVPGILVLSCSIASAFDGDCYLSVHQQVYMDGPCNIELQSDGSFSIGTDSNSPYFAYVNKGEKPDIADGYWNGIKKESHADEDLGSLTRDGGCWANDLAKVCAWRRGTRPPSF